MREEEKIMSDNLDRIHYQSSNSLETNILISEIRSLKLELIDLKTEIGRLKTEIKRSKIASIPSTVTKTVPNTTGPLPRFRNVSLI